MAVLSLGLELHLKFGLTLVIDQFQARELSSAFVVDATCSSRSGSFCVLLPKGKTQKVIKSLTILQKFSQLFTSCKPFLFDISKKLSSLFHQNLFSLIDCRLPNQVNATLIAGQYLEHLDGIYEQSTDFAGKRMVVVNCPPFVKRLAKSETFLHGR